MTYSRFLATALALSLMSAAHAEDAPVSRERARAALLQGRIKPLGELLTAVEARFAGQVIDADLHEDNGKWTYELELMPPDGLLFHVVFDAATGAVIRTIGPVKEKR